MSQPAHEYQFEEEILAGDGGGACWSFRSMCS
jgi:hypothetical protein